MNDAQSGRGASRGQEECSRRVHGDCARAIGQHVARPSAAAVGNGVDSSWLSGTIPPLHVPAEPFATSIYPGSCIEGTNVYMRGGKFGTTSRGKKLGLPRRSMEMQKFAIAYPCISTDVEGICRSLTTILDDMNRDPDNERPLYSRNELDEPRMLDTQKLVQCFSCDLCLGRMHDPYTSLTCLHSFCHRCIKQAMRGGGEDKSCPVPGCGYMTLEGFRPTGLGRWPLQGKYQCIVKDVTLANLIRKFFKSGNRIEEEASDHERLLPNCNLESVWMDDMGHLRRIQAKQAAMPPSIADSEMLSPPVTQTKSLEKLEYLIVAVFSEQEEMSFGEMDDNYFYLPALMTVSQFRCYLEQRFHFRRLELFCEDVALFVDSYEEMSLMNACEELWLPYHHDLEEVFTLLYRHGSPQPSQTECSRS